MFLGGIRLVNSVCYTPDHVAPPTHQPFNFNVQEKKNPFSSRPSPMTYPPPVLPLARPAWRMSHGGCVTSSAILNKWVNRSSHIRQMGGIRLQEEPVADFNPFTIIVNPKVGSRVPVEPELYSEYLYCNGCLFTHVCYYYR